MDGNTSWNYNVTVLNVTAQISVILQTQQDILEINLQH